MVTSWDFNGDIMGYIYIYDHSNNNNNDIQPNLM